MRSLVRRLGDLLAGLALAALSLLVCLALLEGAARLLVWKWSHEPDTYRWPMVVYDPLLGWAKPPGETGWIRREQYHVKLEINSHGLRGPERAWEKPPGVRRILLLGDSFTDGFTVAEKDTVRAVLERELNAVDGPVEVINGGTIGYGTGQEYLFFEHQGERYSPDLVILMFYFNDLVDESIPGYNRPHFELVDGELVLSNVPVPEPDRTTAAQLGRSWRLLPWRGSMALRLLSQRTSIGNPGLHNRLAAWGIVEPARDLGEWPDFLWPFGPPRQVGRGMWDLTGAIVAKLKREVEAAGGELMVFYIPARFEVRDHIWEHTKSLYRLGKRWSRDAVIENLSRLCSELQIDLVDPREAMRQTTGLLYFPLDGHWNEEGNRIAAEQIALRLRASGFASR